MPTAQAPSQPLLPEKSELSSAETARAIGWEEGSLRVARCRGGQSGMEPPPSFKRGSRIVYPRGELVTWMQDRGYRVGHREKP